MTDLEIDNTKERGQIRTINHDNIVKNWWDTKHCRHQDRCA